ncbi:lysophospholipid acyltransferase 5-like isoform X1 [Lineus longissimus]|uniref:lysophospholipid acyltransferase 5-like isoform X1 n=1 Tax=Lineus longissimus TaxID=88925 RepID=UPI00315DEEBF
MASVEQSWISSLAVGLGTNENALRLLISLLLAYPVSLIHRYTLFGKSPLTQHLYFIFFGLGLSYFNFGSEIVFGLANVLIIYLVLLVVGGNLPSVIFSFVFNIGYLVIAYYYTSSQNYDIKWTTPHCVLTLRLTGLAFDVYDGTKKQETLSADQKKTALRTMPSIFEVFAHMYFPCAFLVGPQLPMRRYQDFVSGAFADTVTGSLPACVIPGAKRLSVGVLYIAIYQVLGIYFDEQYMITDEFNDISFLGKLLYIAIWGKVTLYKYVACWLISEGSCMMIGLSYNGKDENGNDLWDACANIKIRKFELAQSGSAMVTSFNLNTNVWVSQYVYKRLRFLNNRQLSQIGALAYLAIWHGIHSGYYNCFLFEFVVIKFERDFASIVRDIPILSSIADNKPLKPAQFALRKLYQMFILGYPLVSFCLLKYRKWGVVYRSIFYIGHIWFYSWPLVYIYLRKTVLKKKRAEEKRTDGEMKKTE